AKGGKLKASFSVSAYMRITLHRLQLAISLLFLTALQVRAQQTITPETALRSYLNNGDKTYRWEIKDTQIIDDVMVYHVLLTSQKWREHVWAHQLSVMVPKERKYDGALLFITGGSVNKEGQPN